MEWKKIGCVSWDENWSDTTYMAYGHNARPTVRIVARKRPTFAKDKSGRNYIKGKNARTSYVVTMDGQDIAKYETLKAAKEAAADAMSRSPEDLRKGN